MNTYIRPFGDSKILFTETEAREDVALTPVISLVNPSGALFINSSQKIIISGIPLTLSVYEGNFPSEFGAGDNYYIYALSVIVNQSLTLFSINPSFPIEIENSFVWYGNRLACTQDIDSKLFMNISISPIQDTNPIYKVTTSGMQLALNNDRELILYENKYKMSDITEYTNVVIGGTPLSAGRIETNWYLIVYPQ